MFAESKDDAFRTQLEPYRRPITLHAYRMLGSLLGLGPREAAALLETTETSVSSLLQRARKSVETRAIEPRSPTGPGEAALLGRLIDTWERGDLDALTGLLAKDAIFSMPP